jgi:hypothetical protein
MRLLSTDLRKTFGISDLKSNQEHMLRVVVPKSAADYLRDLAERRGSTMSHEARLALAKHISEEKLRAVRSDAGNALAAAGASDFLHVGK